VRALVVGDNRGKKRDCVMSDDNTWLLLGLVAAALYLLVGAILALQRAARRLNRPYQGEQGEMMQVIIESLLWPVARVIDR
jgi:hypothetical protein